MPTPLPPKQESTLNHPSFYLCSIQSIITFKYNKHNECNDMVKLAVDEALIRLRAGYIRGRYLREDKVRRNQMVRLGLIKMGSIHRFVFPRLEDAGGDDVIEW